MPTMILSSFQVHCRFLPKSTNLWPLIRRTSKSESHRAPKLSFLAISRAAWPTWIPLWKSRAKHNIRVLEDFSQCVGGRYKGKYVGSMGEIAINSFQLGKTITSGEGGAVVSGDDKLFERAIRFHDVGVTRLPYSKELKGGMLTPFAACNFRMNEFTGAILKGQVQKLETICSRLRANARKVREGIADLPGLKLRKTYDQEGDIGATVFLDHGNRKRRDRFLRALRAEGIDASGPGGSVILPTDPRIENKVTIHPRLAFFQYAPGQSRPLRSGSVAPAPLTLLTVSAALLWIPISVRKT